MSGYMAKDEENGTTNDKTEKKTETCLYVAKGLKKIFPILLALSVSLLDPLFFYIPVTKNDNRKCISLDKKLETTVISLRSLVDLLLAIYIVDRLRYDFFAPCYKMYKEGELVKHIWKKASKYLLRAFPLDFLSAFPLPQVVLLFIVPTMMKGSRFLEAVYLLRSVVLCQYVPRVFTTYRFVTSGSFGEPAKARSMFTPFIFILAINGIGGLWYFLSTERLVQCWQEACENHVGCLNLFRCNDNNVGNHTFLNDFCPRDGQKTDFFDFGMFSDALQSRVVETTDFPKKFLYSLHWSLLSLSCFGQNLETGTYVWENVFAISITISGLLLFLFLLGNLQASLQDRSRRKEEKRRQAQEMEDWKPFRMVPERLKSEVRKFMRYDWLGTVEDDIDKFLDKLPEHLCQRIKVELYFKLMKKLKVPLFEKMEKSLLEAVCHRLSAVFYPAGTCVIGEGTAIGRMLFVMHGTLSVDDGCVNSPSLPCGDFCGEELLSWALYSTTSSTPPLSSRDVIAIENVQALSLKAEDLHFVAAKFGWHNHPECGRYLMEREQAQKMEHWKPFVRVSEHLKSDVRIYLRCDWQETVEDDIDKFLDKLPGHLRERIKVELYFELMKEVPLFEKMEKPLLEQMCYRLSTVFYPNGTYVIQKGEVIDRMLFIVSGRLSVNDRCSGFASLTHGDFCGVELLSWALDFTSSSILPSSSRDVETLHDVEALSLKAEDLKEVATQYPECHRYLMERRQAQEMEDWMPFRMVPEHLKSEVRKFMCYDWRETVGDMDKFLDKLPGHFRQRIKVELYFELIKKVPLFMGMEEPLLEQMCYYLSVVFYPKGTYIIRKWEVIDRMLFIVDGYLSVVSGDSRSPSLKRGDICGEELFNWALGCTSSKPDRSLREIIALENVQAVSLKAEDLKSFAAQFEMYMDAKENQHKPIINSAQSVLEEG